MEEISVSAWVGQHISALHAARRAFTEAECSERIQRALRKQLQPTNERYETGDKVYYKHADSAQWKGPCVVIGQDGAVIFVRHRVSYVRVHHSRLRKTDDSHTVQEEVDKKGQNGEDDNILQAPELTEIDDDSDTGQ